MKTTRLPWILLTAATFVFIGAVVYVLEKGIPDLDSNGRPKMFYGELVHDNCPRRGHFDAGQFALEWGDEGHRAGWCLYRLGCKGPSTWHNCPIMRWNDATSWPIGAGHGCVGCSEPGFWDTMTPFYDRLPHVAAAGLDLTADKIGAAVVGATAVGFAAHGVGKLIQGRGAHTSVPDPAAHASDPDPAARSGRADPEVASS